ncbi:hypothetical protein H0H93_008599 [Arthromyces matolae]|nr:hypothetical protein H0H93_008599 [Arthromyces matolae]
MFAIFSLRRPDILPVGDLGVQRGLAVWFLSLHSPNHNWGWTPKKLPTSSSTKTKKTVKPTRNTDTPTLEANDTPSSSVVTGNGRLPTPDASSVPPVGDEDTTDILPSLPAAFTPSIKNTLQKPGIDEGTTPIPLPEGVTVELLKTRLSGKNKVKGAFLTPKEMEDLTESWKPYRSLESDTLKTPFFHRETSNTSIDHLDGALSPLPLLFKQSETSRKRTASSFSTLPVISLPSYAPTDDFNGLFSDHDHYEHSDCSYPINSPFVASPNSLDLDTKQRSKKGKARLSLLAPLNLDATHHSPHFPSGHQLNPHFVRHYQLEDQLGSGGYGFVMTARHRVEAYEVAVKFIIKSKVPEHSWMEDETIGRLPTEIMLLSFIEHENIVKCLDVFEDTMYFYLIQELHGSPWQKGQRKQQIFSVSPSSSPFPLQTPELSPSTSISSLPSSAGSSPSICSKQLDCPKSFTSPLSPRASSSRPEYSRRPSHDLFECIEQSEYKRLSEKQARYVFAQVVDVVYYLDTQGVTHRDIKDENLVIDRDLKVKLIDFGSAAIVDPDEPRPYYTLFYGTTAYASPEILLKKPYQAPPAEIWTLGVLLSFLLTGTSPFPTAKDAIQGRIILPEIAGLPLLSDASLDLMKRCLDPNPKTRATIAEVKAHGWFSKLL